MRARYGKIIGFLGVLSLLLCLSGTSAQALDTSSLNGSFHIVDRGGSFFQMSTSVSASIEAGNSNIFFDGAGACSITGGGTGFNMSLTNPGPVNISPYTDDDSCTYVLNFDGSGQITMLANGVPKNFWVGTDSNGAVNSFTAGESYAPPGAGQFGADGEYRTSQVMGIKVGPSYDPALLHGTFHMVSQDSSFWASALGGGSPTLYGSSGALTFDGNGGCTLNFSGRDFYINYTNPAAPVVASQPDTTVKSCTYTVFPGGSAQLRTSPTDIYDFWVNFDGSVAISASAGTRPDPPNGTGYEVSRMVAVKAGSAMNASSLQGLYQVGSLDSNFWKDTTYGGISLDISASNGMAAFDGAGNCSLNLDDLDFNVSISYPPSAVYSFPGSKYESCTYTVSATGAVQLTNSNGKHYFWLSPDSSMLIGGGPAVESHSNGTSYSTDQIVGVRTFRFLSPYPLMEPYLDGVPLTDLDGNYQVSWRPYNNTSPQPAAMNMPLQTASNPIVYTLQESTSPDFPPGPLTRIAYSGPSLTASITGRAKGQSYYYQIQASQTGYESSPWSKGFNPCSIPAAPPAAFKVPATASGDYLLSWTPSTTPDVTYIVEEDTDAAFTTPREVYNGSGSQVTIFGNPVGTYYYHIIVLKQGVPPSLPKNGSNICNVIKKVVPTLSLALSANSIILGRPVTASGVITASNEALAGRLINLNISKPDASVVTLSVVSDANGAFSFSSASLGDVFSAPGLYLLQAGAGSLDPAMSPVLTVRVLPLAGYAIIVQGRAADDEGAAAYGKTAARTRNALIARGFNDTDILMITSTSGDSGKAALQTSITAWAKGKLDVTAAPLQLLLIDHGDPELFHLDPDTLTPAELSGMLDTLEASISHEALAQPRTIVIGSCYSGSFIPALAKAGRIIISSAGPTEQSFRGPAEPDGIRSGEYFLDELYRNLKRGASLRDAFNSSATLIHTYTRRGDIVSSSGDVSLQNPLFSFAGDTVGMSEVPTGMADDAPDSVYLGGGDNFDYNPTGMLPQDRHATLQAVFLDAVTSSATITAPGSAGMNAWFEVRAPSALLEQDYGSGQLISDLPRVVMTYNAVTGQYQGLYAAFTEAGSYDVIIYQQEPASGDITSRHITVYRNRLNNTPALPPLLKSPSNGVNAATSLVVDWSESVDPDGDIVTYTLLISKHADLKTNTITDPALVKEGLKDPLDVVLHADGLLDLTSYYWQVWAIDSYGAITKSALQTFTTNNTNGLLGYIKGYVLNTFDAPVAGAVVKAADGISFTSLSGGGYLIPVPPKTYMVETTAANYLPNTVSVTAASGEVTIKNITLTPSNAAHTISTTIANGNGFVDCPAKVMAGDQMTCTIQAGAGFQFASIEGCGGGFVGNRYSATPSSDCTITASFVPAGTAPYKVTSTHNAGGNIVCIPASVALHGSSACSISINSGYRVNSLIDNTVDATGSIVSNSYTVSDVTLNRVIAVEFIRFTVTSKPLSKPIVYNKPSFTLTAAVPLGITPEQLAAAVQNLPGWASVLTTKVSKTTGTITLSFVANPTYVEREQTIVVGDGSFRLWQDGIPCPLPIVAVSPVGIIGSKGGVDVALVNVTVPEGCGWNVVIPATATWLSVEPDSGTGDGSFTFTAAANEAAAVRKTNVAVSGDKGKKTVSVVQNTHVGDYAGTYAGTYDGTSGGSPDSGTFSLVFSASGAGKVVLTSSLSGKIYTVSLGKINADGDILNSKLENIGYIDLTSGAISATVVNSTVTVTLTGTRQ